MNKDLINALLNWYDIHQRDLPWRHTTDPYGIWLSEIMLQQTQVQTVIPYYRRFLETLPNIAALASVDDDTLHKLWEGLGYYRRATMLKKAAQEVITSWGGELPDRYDDLLTLPGIGPYTAGAIASIAFDERVAAVDGNLMRILSRLYADFTPIGDEKAQRHFRPMAQALIPAHRPGDFNQALMDIGAGICRSSGQPLCDQCPLIPWCLAYQQDLTSILPRRIAKKERREEWWTILLLRYQDEVYIEKRSARGLLASLWQFYLLDGSYPAPLLKSLLHSLDWSIDKVIPLPQSQHLFTHRHWHMIGYFIYLNDKPSLPGLWVKNSSLLKDYSIPSAFQAYRKALLEDPTF